MIEQGTVRGRNGSAYGRGHIAVCRRMIETAMHEADRPHVGGARHGRVLDDEERAGQERITRLLRALLAS